VPAPALSAYEPAYQKIREGSHLLKEGDLVLRDGLELSSQVIKQFSRQDKSFSHAGLVFFENGHPLVYHIVPGDENPDMKVRFDSLQQFCNPRKNGGYGIYRYNLDEKEVGLLKEYVLDCKRRGVQFDSLFNMATNDKMYCSEMIRKGLASATDGRIRLSTTKPNEREVEFYHQHMKFPKSYLAQLQVVAIDNLFINPACTPVRTYSFNPNP
jgi:hypothetical protein